MADLIQLLRKNQVSEQGQQPKIEVSKIYAVALEDSENGTVKVKFDGVPGAYDNPLEEPSEGVVVLENEYFDNDINAGQIEEEAGEEESGASDNE